MPRLPLRVVLATLALAAPAALACSSFSPVAPEPDAASSDAGVRDASEPTDAPADVAPDACDADQGRGCGDRFVFLTTGALPGSFADGAATALTRADLFCAEQATIANAMVLRNRRWKAFLCTSTVDAIDRVASVEARWTNASGETLWPTTAALRAGGPVLPIGPMTPVWTGCDTRGITSDGFTCEDWTATVDAGGAHGQAAQTTQRWASASTTSCAERLPIYCFEDAK